MVGINLDIEIAKFKEKRRKEREEAKNPKEIILEELEKIIDLQPIEQEEIIIKLSKEYSINKTSLQKQLKLLSKKNNNFSMDKNISNYWNMRNLAEQFIDLHPCWYDNAKNWWIWDYENTKWKLVDETDILNAIESQARVDTIASKVKTEVLEALKQVSRQNKPQEIKPTWIQFKDEIYDIETGERFKARPTWFICNPIPWKLEENNFEATPTMDRIFEEWVGKDHVKTLYEIIAYCMLPDYPIHRIFCFIGSGCNGKGRFLQLLIKFVGIENTCSTELDTLISSRFEGTRLHKKLVCQMGETNFGEISKTSILKKLTGQDLIGFEYKNKKPFEDVNYAKIIIATNNLPSTTDKTDGFYRRWMIIDFPNRFSEEKDILSEIPEEEYSALALKCCAILKDLLEKRKFTNEGSIEERKATYEAKSNFLDLFIKEFTEKDELGYILVGDFNKKFASWCKENRHRDMSDIVIGKKLKDLGFTQERKFFNWLSDGKGGNARSWIGIKWKIDCN